MDQATWAGMDFAAQMAYLNEQLAAGRDYEEILAEVGMTKRDAGVAGFIKIGNMVKEKPGRGENGFAW